MEKTDNFLYALKYDEEQLVMFQDVLPNIDYLYLLKAAHVTKEIKPLYDKVFKALEAHSNTNSFFPYLPQLFFLNYYFQRSTEINNVDKPVLQKIAKELYSLINLSDYPDLQTLHYPYLQRKQRNNVQGNYTKREIERRTHSYIEHIDIFKNIKNKINDYESVLISNKIDLQKPIDLLAFDNLPSQLNFIITPEYALSQKNLTDALQFSEVKDPRAFLALCVEPQAENKASLIKNILAPPSNYWSLLYYRVENKNTYTPDNIAFVEKYNIDRLSFITTHDFTKAYKGTWEEISAMVKESAKKNFLALYFEQHTFIKTQIFEKNIEPELEDFRVELEAKMLKINIASEIPKISVELPLKTKFKL